MFSADLSPAHPCLPHGSYISVHLQFLFVSPQVFLSNCCFGTHALLRMCLFRSFYLFFLVAICLHCTVHYCISVSWEEGRKGSTFTKVSCSKAWWQEKTFPCKAPEECNLYRRAVADLCLYLRLLQVWSQLFCRMSPQGGSLGAGCLCVLRRESTPVIPVDLLPYFVSFKPVWRVVPRNAVKATHHGICVGFFFLLLFKQECSAFPIV